MSTDASKCKLCCKEQHVSQLGGVSVNSSRGHFHHGGGVDVLNGTEITFYSLLMEKSIGPSGFKQRRL